MVIKSRNKSRKKRLLIVACIGLLLLTVILILLIRNSREDSQSPSPVISENLGTTSQEVNFDPPTAADLEETDNHKKDITNPSESPPVAGNGSKKNVSPMVSGADRSTITAYVVGVFEEGGTCTATITQGATSFNKTSIGFGNSSYTQCMPIDISSGAIDDTKKWTVVVSYNSSAAIGTSSVTTVSP